MSISREQALDCFRSDDLIGIGMEADAVRRRLHPEGVVSYAVGRTIECADADVDAICERVGEAVDAGCSVVTLRGAGVEPARFERVVREIKKNWQGVSVQGLSVPEVLAMAGDSGRVRETLVRLHDAGLESIGGDGVESGSSVAEWVEVHRGAHGVGMRTTAAMVFGFGETPEELVDRLTAVRELQEETGGFTAFVPVSYKPQERELGWHEQDGATAVEGLKTLAISRVVLDNIENVQANGATGSLKVLQMALRFGSNDAGWVAVGAPLNGGSEEDVRRVIRDAGFRPVERDALYRTMFLS